MPWISFPEGKPASMPISPFSVIETPLKEQGQLPRRFLYGKISGPERLQFRGRVGTGRLRINPSSLVSYHAFLSRTKPDLQYQKENGHAFGLNYEYELQILL